MKRSTSSFILNSSKFSPLLFVFFILILSSCGSRELKVAITPQYHSIQAVTIATKCTVCHSSLSTYAGLMQIVTAGNPADSKLYEVIDEGSMPQWSPKLSDAEIQAIYNWIKNGAAND